LDVEEGDDKGSGDGTEGKVDVEAPAPSQVVCESSTHQWTSNRRNAVHASNESHVSRATSQRHSDRDDQDSSREDTSRSHTSDRASNNEGRRIWRNTTDERADLEDEESDEVDPFNGVIRVELSVDELGCACGE
jgi:hypothetical protein